MSTDKTEKQEPTFESLQAELDAALAELSEAFKSGTDGDVSYLSGKIRAIEEEMKQMYYARWGIP